MHYAVGMLPDIPNLTRISKAIAMLDAILCQEWEFRYYSFNSRWSQNDPNQMMASMRNGSGDHYFIWFSPVGVAIKGFAHESKMSTNDGRPFAGVLESVPEEFAEFLAEPAFVINDTTFCLWRKADEREWHSGDIVFPAADGEDVDGSRTLLSILDGEPATYVRFASDYFELDVDEEAVSHVYNLRPLTADILARLSCDRSLDELAEDIAEIGYPHKA